MIVEPVSSYCWQTNKPFHDFSEATKQKFGTRMQKISIDAGFTCPNRDGAKSSKGCTFCNNTFKPFYCTPDNSIKDQIDHGIRFFSSKYPKARFLAFFQDYSNTYAPIEVLKKAYQYAIDDDRIEGLVISTRPDCVQDEVLTLLSEINQKKMVWIEFGVESTYDITLERINRQHTFSDVQSAIHNANQLGLNIGAHIMLGLPGESQKDFIAHAHRINALPINRLKIHQLQILTRTQMAREYREKPNEFMQWSAEDYMDTIIHFLEVLRPDIQLERFLSHSPAESIIYPKWGIKNDVFTKQLIEVMQQRNTYQGKYYKTKD